MFNKKRKFQNTFAPPSENSSFLDVISPGIGSVVEVSTFWNERLLKTYTFPSKGAVYLSNKESANSVVVPKAYSVKGRVKILKITSKSVECYPVKSKFSYYSKGEEVPYSALVESSRLNKNSSGMGVFIKQGDLVSLGSDTTDFHLTINYKKPSFLAQSGKLINMSLSELSVLLLSFVALLFLFLYNRSLEIPLLEEAQTPTKQIKVVFKKIKKLVVKKETNSSLNKPSSSSSKPSRAQRKHPKKTKVVVKSNSRTKKKKLAKKGAVFQARRSRKNGNLKGRRSSGVKPKKVNVNSVGLLGIFGTKGIKKQLSKNSSGSGGLYGLAQSQKKGDGVGISNDSSVSRFGSGLKGQSGGSIGSNVKVGGGIGSYGSANGVGGGSVDLGSPSKVSVSYAGELGDDFVGGGIDSSGIYRVIQAHKNVIRFCYQKEQDYYPALSGLVRLYWRINDRGRVVNAKIKKLSTSNMRGVGNCIVKNLRSWQFPKAPKSRLQAVEFPFRFKKK